MAVVSIRIHGKDYQVACDDGEEEHLQFLAQEVDERMKILVRGMRAHPGETMAMLLTSLTLADEIIENKRDIAYISEEVQRLASLVSDDKKLEQDTRLVEIENAMAITLEEIAQRIEKIADRIELS